MQKFKEPLFQNADFAVFNKPSGFNTHAQDPTHPGFVEIAEQSLSDSTPLRLKVVHRLDRGTSGLLILAKTDDAAKIFFDLFSQRQMQKTYLFVTEHQVGMQKYPFKQTISVSGEIREVKSTSAKQNRKTFQLMNGKTEHSSRDLANHDSWTDFEQLQDFGHYQLWRAKPKTGRPHQIRLHAQFLKVPILGDSLYGGSSYPRLMLHAESLEFTFSGEKFQFEVEFPEIQNLSADINSPGLAVVCGLTNRSRFLSWQNYDSLRLCHLESDKFKMDRYGPVDWYYWYSEQDFPIAWLEDQIESYSKENRSFHFRRMTNRGSKHQAQQEIWSHPQAPQEWIAQENGICYVLKADQGLSPGLFLDQHDQRQWALKNCPQQKVLNLFSYTCGFSVCAAKAGASEVVSVDTSRKLLDWGKENFKLNGLDPEKYSFFAQDVFVYLKGAKKRNLKFDFIICDPPSFGRSQEGVWSITKDLTKLLKELSKVLAPNGNVILTTNYESWDEKKFQEITLSALKDEGIKIRKFLRSGFDFEPAPTNNTLLKGLLLQKS